MLASIIFEHLLQVFGDLDHRRVGVVWQGEVDRQCSHLSVGRHQASGDLWRVHGDLLDARQAGFVQRFGTLDQRSDGEVVPDGFAVVVVGQRIDPDGVRRLPGGFRQRLHQGKRLPGEHRGARGYGDQGRVGLRVGILQGLVGEQLGVVLVEQDPMVVRDADEHGTRREREHGEPRDGQHGPTPIQDRRGIAVQGHSTCFSHAAHLPATLAARAGNKPRRGDPCGRPRRTFARCIGNGTGQARPLRFVVPCACARRPRPLKPSSGDAPTYHGLDRAER